MKKRLICPYCKEELEDWVKEEELPKIAECCKTFKKWTGRNLE